MSVRFQLGENSDGSLQKPFTESGTDVMTLPSGLRMSARIMNAGKSAGDGGEAAAGASLALKIYGMTLSQMNQLATLGMVYAQIRQNKVTVLAGDVSAPLAIAFIGSVQQAWIDFSAMPDVAFHVSALALGAESVLPADPTSIKQGVDVASLMEGFAKQMNLTFENNGVDAKLPASYFYGSPASQASACAAAAGISWFVDRGVLAIWPKGKSRGGTVPLISKKTGLVGYPAFTSYGLALRTVFNPDLRFQAQVKVQTDLDKENAPLGINSVGNWTIYTLDHDIESMVPNGKWFTDITCYNQNYPLQVAAIRRG